MYERLIEWLEHQEKELSDQVRVLEDGTVRTGSKTGDEPWVDTTQSNLARAQQMLEQTQAHLEKLHAKSEA
jgi:hypothetical protein